jgi:hypothetical protein
MSSSGATAPKRLSLSDALDLVLGEIGYVVVAWKPGRNETGPCGYELGEILTEVWGYPSPIPLRVGEESNCAEVNRQDRLMRKHGYTDKRVKLFGWKLSRLYRVAGGAEKAVEL